jgi:hypothetical protein
MRREKVIRKASMASMGFELVNCCNENLFELSRAISSISLLERRFFMRRAKFRQNTSCSLK